MINTPILLSATSSLVLAQTTAAAPSFAVQGLGAVLGIILGTLVCAAVITLLSGPIAKTKVAFVPALITSAIVMIVTQVIGLVPLLGLISIIVFPVLMILLLKQRHSLQTWPAVGLTAIMYVAFIVIGLVVAIVAAALALALGLAAGATP
jgi:hypothetical protein